MRSRFLLLGLILPFVALAQNIPAPYQIKADQLGEDIVRWTINNPHSERCDDALLDDLPPSGNRAWIAYCLTRDPHNAETFTYGTAPLQRQIAWFHNGILRRVDLTFANNEALPRVILGLKQKFGKKFSKQTTHLYNGFGSQFEERRWIWTNKMSTLQLSCSTAPGATPQLTFTLELPGDHHLSRRAQISMVYEDM